MNEEDLTISQIKEVDKTFNKNNILIAKLDVDIAKAEQDFKVLEPTLTFHKANYDHMRKKETDVVDLTEFVKTRKGYEDTEHKLAQIQEFIDIKKAKLGLALKTKEDCERVKAELQEYLLQVKEKNLLKVINIK